MAYQRGSLRQVRRKRGDVWMLRFRNNAGRENTLPVGLVKSFPTEKAAWREVDRLGLLIRINNKEDGTRITFAELAEHYLRTDVGEDAMRPKSINTVRNLNHLVRDYLVRQFGDCIADEIKSLDIQKWLKSLHADKGLAWPSVAKIRSIMGRIYKMGMLHEKVTKNPVLCVETRAETSYKAVLVTPAQTIAILQAMQNPLHTALVLTCAATALRASELVALRWYDIRWAENRIQVCKRWAGSDGKTKTKASDAFVPMHPALAAHLRDWRGMTPFSGEMDFVFPSLKMDGKVPLSPSIFVKTYLRPAAINAGVLLAKGQRFGLHNLRHSLSNWLVNKAKVEPKTVQAMLRHAKIETTLNRYTQGDGDETQAAQGQFLEALGMPTGMVQ